MNYSKIYEQLINRALCRNITEDYEYYERHHIIPRCMGGANTKENIVLLTAREHYIAHGLLYMINQKTEYASKLIYAFRLMSCGFDRRPNSHDYAWMRKVFSKHHPMKDSIIAAKARDKIINYYNNETEECRHQRIEAIRAGLKKRIESMSPEELQQESQKRSDILLNSYIIDPTRRERVSNSLKQYYENETEEQYIERCKFRNETCLSEEANKKRSMTLSTKLSKMTDAERKEYTKRSLGSADHIKRGKSISLAKKGKKTDQVKIEQEKYGKMSDIEFENFIRNRRKFVQQRMRNRREQYLNAQ